jgi:hypothetical protein
VLLSLPLGFREVGKALAVNNATDPFGEHCVEAFLPPFGNTFGLGFFDFKFAAHVLSLGLVVASAQRRRLSRLRARLLLCAALQTSQRHPQLTYVDAPCNALGGNPFVMRLVCCAAYLDELAARHWAQRHP